MNNRGQGLTEYLVILAVIGVAAIGISRTVGSSLRVGFGKTASAIQGKDYKGADATEVTKTKTSDVNMSDFAKAAR